MKVNLQEALLENEEAILTQEEIDSLGYDDDYDYYQFEIDGDYEFKKMHGNIAKLAKHSISDEMIKSCHY
jgi:hypothetical protein